MSDTPELSRVITLPMLVLYGLGITIGAGIYVLIGQAVAQAGTYAPMSFLLAALVMLFSAGTFAEFSGRIPQAAGEAVFVQAGFQSKILTVLTGGIIILSAIVAASTIALGGTGYIVALTGWNAQITVGIVIAIMGLIAIWGIRESVMFAGLFTILEVLALIVIIAAGFWQSPDMISRLGEVVPPLTEGTAYSAVFITSLIAFFAFIGFDDVVNLVEETRDPVRIMPKAIGWTLLLATLLYFLVALVAVLAVPREALITSDAPISVMYGSLTGVSPVLVSLIAIVATLNGVIIQIVMAARVVYGMAKKGKLPAKLAEVNARTHTPVLATILITAASILLALFFPLAQLAEWTTMLILIVFAVVNAALVMLKIKRIPAPEGVFTVGIYVPILGFFTCVIWIIGPIILRFTQ